MNAFSTLRRTLQKIQQPRSNTTENASSNIDGALQNMMPYLQQFFFACRFQACAASEEKNDRSQTTLRSTI
jgi:hypothetical protein